MAQQNDAFVRVAADGSGKRLETALISTPTVEAAGSQFDVYRQRAEIVGDVGDAIQQLVAMSQIQVQLLKAILATLSATSNTAIVAEDFSPSLTLED